MRCGSRNFPASERILLGLLCPRTRCHRVGRDVNSNADVVTASVSMGRDYGVVAAYEGTEPDGAPSLPTPGGAVGAAHALARPAFYALAHHSGSVATSYPAGAGAGNLRRVGVARRGAVSNGGCEAPVPARRAVAIQFPGAEPAHLRHAWG